MVPRNGTSIGWSLLEINEKEKQIMAKSEANAVAVVSIPLANLIPDYQFNARRLVVTKDKDGKEIKEYTGTKEMMDSFKARGQETPCLVRPLPNGKFSIVFGFTRYNAAKALGWESLACQVKPMDEKEAFLANLTENMVRDDLKPFEIAAQCARIRKEFKVSGDEIGKLTGKTKSYVNNLMRYYDSLAPKLLRLWEGDHILMVSQDNLNTLAAMRKDDKERSPDHAAQLKWWDEQKLGGGMVQVADGAADGATGNGKPDKAKRPNTTQLTRALTQIKKTVKASPSRDAVISTLRWVLGDLKSGIPGFYDPRKSEEKKSEDRGDDND